MKKILLIIFILTWLQAETKSRARDLGFHFDGSGDIFIAFSTANSNVAFSDGTVNVEMLPNWMMSPLFEATVQAVEEAIVNTLVAAETMEGINNNKVWALPHDRLIQIMKKYNRIN